MARYDEDVDPVELDYLQKDIAKDRENGKEYLHYEDVLDIMHTKPGAGAGGLTAAEKEEMARIRLSIARALVERLYPQFVKAQCIESGSRDGFFIRLLDAEGRVIEVEYGYENGLTYESDVLESMIKDIEFKAIEARRRYLERAGIPTATVGLA